MTGNVYKYQDFDSMVTAGAWGGNPEHIDMNFGLFSQGWTSERVKTIMHEGYHSFYGGESDTQAEYFADLCVNW